jgi:hypothetical protein
MQSLKNDFNIGAFNFFDYFCTREGCNMVVYARMQYF